MFEFLPFHLTILIQKFEVKHAVDRACQAIVSAPQGQRNNTLNNEAFKLGRMVDNGGIERLEAERALELAANQAGLESREATATIRSGLDAGERTPPLKEHQGKRNDAEGDRVQHQQSKEPAQKAQNLDSRFIGTRWPRKERPQEGTSIDISFDKMANLVKNPSATNSCPVNKGDLPQWTLALFKGGCRRLDHFKSAHGLVLDIDGGGWQSEDLKREFKTWTFIAHTTWSHDPDGGSRWRVMIPLARSVSAAEYRRLMEWAARRFPGIDCADPSKAFYVPVSRPNYQHVYTKAKPLDPDIALAEEDRMKSEAVLEPLRLGGFLSSEVETIKRRLRQEECPIPVPWPSIGKLIGGGWWPGLTIVVGSTGVGKSQFALQAAHHAVTQNTPVLYIGLELDRLGIACRLLALRSGAHWSDIYLGEPVCMPRGKNMQPLNTVDIVKDHEGILNEMPFYFEPGATLGWDATKELDRMCKNLRAKYPTGPLMIVLDFLQLVGGPEREQLRERIGRAAYTGRAIARDYGAAVILISSTARQQYEKLVKEGGKGNPARLVGLGKESGEIEYAADLVLVLVPGEGSPRRHVHLAAAKVRAGVPGWAELEFDGTEFLEIDSDGSRIDCEEQVF